MPHVTYANKILSEISTNHPDVTIEQFIDIINTVDCLLVLSKHLVDKELIPEDAQITELGTLAELNEFSKLVIKKIENCGVFK